MRQNIQIQYRNPIIQAPQASRHYNISINQQHNLNQPYPSQNLTYELSHDQSNINPEENAQNQEIVQSSNINQSSNDPNSRSRNEGIKVRQINVITNKNKGVMTSRPNLTNVSVPSLIKINNVNNKNISRNADKKTKFSGILDQRNQSNIRSKVEDNKNHVRSKSYFTERKMISNSLPKQKKKKKLLSHSVEIKRRTIIRGDKYNNIQITHIISVSKQNTDNDFHIIEKLSTSELNKKPLDLTKIKLYIKKDPNAKSYYNTSCRNVPLKSAEKILKTTYYQHAGGRGMTNLKTKNLNSKYYQSEIINIIRKENKKKAPSVKIISEFRSNPLTNRNSKIAGKYDTNYRTLNKTYEGLNTEITDKHINQENLTKKYQKPNEKENEIKNQVSHINYNQINIRKNLTNTSRGNMYNSRNYLNNNLSNYNNNIPKEEPKKEQKKEIIVNVNPRPNKNICVNNQNYNINNYKNQIETPSFKTKINETKTTPTIKDETKNDIPNIISTRVDSDKNNNPKVITIQTKIYKNNLPLTNINQRNNNQYTRDIGNKYATNNVQVNLEDDSSKNYIPKTNKIEIKTYNTNIKPSINSRNINNIQKNTYTSNINKNYQHPQTKTQINNRYSTKNQDSNNSNKYNVTTPLESKIKVNQIPLSTNNLSASLNNEQEQKTEIPKIETEEISNINNTSIPSRNYYIKTNININQNTPFGINRNINSQNKPEYKCITYQRPEKNMTNVTHYINKISNNSPRGQIIKTTNLINNETIPNI